MKKTCIVLILSLTFINLCKAQKKFPKVNTNFNSKYRKSKEFFTGNINKSNYKTFIRILERELDTIIPNGKSIMINFNQRATNCHFANADITNVTNKRIQTSSIMSKEHNAVYFFVYTKDAFHKDQHQKDKRFILDRGYFHRSVFTEHKNCKGIFVLKPNGEFLRYYGEDNYMDADTFLRETAKWKK